MENNKNILSIRHQRKFPIPKQVNYYLLNNYARRFYNAKKIEEKSEILMEISTNIEKFGYNIEANELMRRLKNMKAHYRRKKEDFASGMIKKVEWEYFELMDAIFKDTLMSKKQPVRQRTKAQVKAFDDTPMPSSVDPSTSTTVNTSEYSVEHNLKRQSDQNDQEELEIKKEKRVCNNENLELAIINDTKIETPKQVDTSMKRTKVIQFNNIADITSQLPITSIALATEDSKQIAIKQIALELKKLDGQRLELDEQRLHLEIKRNEIDKAAYMLTEILSEITKH